MDFNKALEVDFRERVRPRVERRNQLRQEIAAIKKQVEVEQAAIDTHEANIDQLEEQVGAALAAGGDAYDKLDRALDAARLALAKSQKRQQHLQSLLPEKQADFHQSLRRLEEIRILVARENLPMVQTQIDGHVEMILSLYDGWLLAHQRAAKADGDGFTVPRDCRPRIRHDRLQEKGDIRSLPGEKYAELLKEEEHDA